MKSSFLRKISPCVALAAIFLIGPQIAHSQTPPPPAWELTKYFQYNIENVLVNSASLGTWNVKVIFSVTNPNPDAYVPNLTWNIQGDSPFRSTGASLTMNIAWDATEVTNTGSQGAALAPVSTTSLGTGAALPIQIRNLTSPGPTTTQPTNPPQVAKPCTAADCPGIADLTNRFWVRRAVTPVAFVGAVTYGRVAIEGKPVCNGTGCPTTTAPFANIPVRSAVANFSFLDVAMPTSALISDPRRKIVDFDTKCIGCHDGTKLSEGVLIPRLSLHGNNRTENLSLCVMCHNPNQTDVPYRALTADPRTSAPETSVDFKRMVHSIHAGGFRKTPFVVIGFNTSINDYSSVRFPTDVKNCLACHVVDSRGKGTFELPLQNSVLGSTINTGSVYAVTPGATRTIDVNPNNDLKISPTAATCSGCHDEREVQSHMIKTGGASFSTLQREIGVTVKERCVNCHGPGKEKDVRKVHGIQSGSGGRDD